MIRHPFIAKRTTYALWYHLSVSTIAIPFYQEDRFPFGVNPKRQVKSSGEISLGHHAERFATLETTSAFRLLLTLRNFTGARFRSATALTFCLSISLQINHPFSSASLLLSIDHPGSSRLSRHETGQEGQEDISPPT